MLKALGPKAVERLEKALDSKDEKNAIRACIAVLDKTVATLTKEESLTPPDPIYDIPRETLEEMLVHFRKCSRTHSDKELAVVHEA